MCVEVGGRLLSVLASVYVASIVCVALGDGPVPARHRGEPEPLRLAQGVRQRQVGAAG